MMARSIKTHENLIFGTAINCMDGRTQLPVLEWMKKNYDVEYVDMITEAGPDKIVGDCVSAEKLESIKFKIGISVNKHGSKVVAVVAHHDCAGNPVSKEKHLECIKKCIEIIKSWGFSGVEVIGLWVNDEWKVECVGEVKV